MVDGYCTRKRRGNARLTNNRRESFERLKRRAPPGIDGVRWAVYQEGLLKSLTDLHDRIQQGSYRASPSKRVRIAKEDGSVRKLSIASLEDKIVQQAVANPEIN